MLSGWSSFSFNYGPPAPQVQRVSPVLPCPVHISFSLLGRGIDLGLKGVNAHVSSFTQAQEGEQHTLNACLLNE